MVLVLRLVAAWQFVLRNNQGPLSSDKEAELPRGEKADIAFKALS